MKIVEEETNLEDLIVLGDDKKIPISIEFPNGETKIKAKALVKPLTLAEIDKIKLNQDSLLETQLEILKISLFKTNGDLFSEKELLKFPVGVVAKISENILEISGVEVDGDKLRNF